MTSSDIIAIIAMVISAIVSIASAYISFQNNKANIQARRLEMSFEKQLDAFKDLNERTGEIRAIVFSANEISKTQRSVNKYFNTLSKIYDDYYASINKYRVYLPSNIQSAYVEFADKVADYLSKANIEDNQKLYKALDRKENQILSLLNQYMGFEAKSGNETE